MNHRTSRPHRSGTNGTAERAVRGMKEGTSVVLLQSGLDEKWWVDSVECYCFLWIVQDLLADGRTPSGKRFGEPLKGPIVPFGAMADLFRYLQKTSQGSTNSVGKSYQEYSSGTHWLRGESGREIFLEKSTLEGSMRRLCCLTRVKISDSQPQTAQQNCFEDIMKFENQLCGSMTLQWRSPRRTSKKTRINLNQQKQKRTLKPSLKETSFVVIMLNLEFVSMCKKKSHSQYHWSFLTQPGHPTEIWMWCKKSASKIIGMVMGIEFCQICGQDLRSSRC